MSNNSKSQGILPPQMNIDLLAKVFPMLNTDPAESINIYTNETKVSTDASKTLVLTGNAITQFELPVADNIGLEYKIQNNTDHDVKIFYTMTPAGSSEPETFIYWIHPDGMWSFYWNGKKWVATDMSTEEVLSSVDQGFSPAASKTVIFDLDEDYSMQLPNGLNAGIELQLFNRSESNHVYVTYWNDGKFRLLWLPPKSKYSGNLKWDGSSWLNYSKDEWVLPYDSTINVEPEYIHRIKKDVNESILHIAPATTERSWLYLETVGVGTKIDCILDDSLKDLRVPFRNDTTESVESEDENEESEPVVIPATKLIGNDEQFQVEVYDVDHLDQSKFNVALSNVLPSVEIEFDGRHNGTFEFIPVRSAAKGYITSINPIYYSICGIHSDIIVDISSTFGLEEITLVAHQAGTSADTIPIGTKMYLRNNASRTCHVKVNTVDNHIDESAAAYVGRFDVRPHEPLTLTYNGYAFVLYDQPMIGATFAAPLDGHILRPVTNWALYNSHALKTIRMMKTSKFQMESKKGKPYVYIAEKDVEISFDDTLTDYIGKDVYLYLVAGISADDESCIFKWSTLLPDAFQLKLQTDYPDYTDDATSMIIGGCHIAVFRKVDQNYVPIKSNTEVHPVSTTADEWADYSQLEGDAAWIQNVAIGIVPNTIWDVSHRPICYDISRPDRQLGGMMKMGTVWVDLYKISGHIDRSGGDSGPLIEFANIGSYYGKKPITNMDYFTAVSLASAIGKRLLTKSEWIAAASWTPGNTRDTDYVATSSDMVRNGAFVDDNGNYSPTGKFKYAISAYNTYNCVGQTGEIVDCLNYADSGAGAWAWSSNNGSDYFGQSYLPNGKETVAVMGGDYDTEVPGSRTAVLSFQTKEHNSKLSVRFACDSTL